MTLRKQVIAPVLALVAAAGVIRAATDCCGPVYNHEPRNIAWRLEADDDVPLSVYIPIAEDAAQKWNTDLANRGMNVSLTQGSGDLRIVFSKDYYYPTMLYHPDQNMIVLPKELTTDPKFTADFILAVFLHEFGHPLGWGQAPCVGTSVMSDTTLESFKTVFTDCDRSTFDTYWKKTDNDGDGYSPEEGDCNDNDSTVYPGATLTCGLAGEDKNCNGVDDSTEEACTSWSDPGSPIIIDVVGNGFSLTNRANGVRFDLNVDGSPEQLPWTAVGVDDSWLVLDRNGNGTIDHGAELFGNFTSQPASEVPNGYVALAVFDSRGAGGNANGWIDSADQVFMRLRLWRDANHDGVSQPAELTTLSAAGITGLSLNYRENLRQDQWGNWFRFFALIRTNQLRDLGPLSYDVFLGGKPRRPARR